jgi:hypothetical protein
MQHNPPQIQLPPGSVSFFVKGENKQNERAVGVPKIFNAIRSDQEVKKRTESYQHMDDKAKAQEYAIEAFAVVTWPGRFITDHSAEVLQEHSGLIAARLRNLSHERWHALWSELQQIEYVHILTADKDNLGLIIIFRVDCQSLIDHQAFTIQLTDYLQDNFRITTVNNVADGEKPELDPKSMAIDWACQITHCPDIYYNPESAIMPLLAEYRSTVSLSANNSPPSYKSPPAQLRDKIHEERIFSEQQTQSEFGDHTEASSRESTQLIGLFKLQTANRWIAEAKRKPIPEMLLDEFWLEGEICIMFAEANQGKTIIAVQAGDSISRGVPIEGFRMKTSPQPVLYLDFELSAKQFEARYSENFTNHYHWHDNFIRIEINPDADIPIGVSFEDYLNESMEEAIKETQAKILIVDNITYLRNDTESAKDAGPLMKYLKALKQRYNLSLLILAHCPKRDASRPLTRNDLQGSSRLNQFADSMIALGASAKDTQLKYLKQVKVRSTAYRYDSDNVMVCQIIKKGSFLMLEQLRFSTEQEHLKQPSEKDTANLDEQVTALYKEKKTQKQIALDLGISQPKVSRILTKLGVNK